jgi:hypothetical protein
VSQDFPYLGLGHWRIEGEVLQLHEWRSGKKTRSRPSEGGQVEAIHLREDRWHRSKDLANLEFHKVRTQTLGAPSHEDAKSEKKDSRWIWVIGGLLDQKPHRLLHTWGSEVERGHF